MKTTIAVIFTAILSCYILPNHSIAQKLTPTVTASAGDHFVSAEVSSLDWTLGEVVVETFEKVPFILTQGFHQPDLGVIVSWNNPSNAIEIKAFPNPTSDWLYLETNYPSTLSIELFDLTGRLLFRTPLSQNESIYMGDLSAGIYLVRIREGKNLLKVFRISKARL